MTERVLFQDVIPYDVPSSKTALRGPSSGTLTLPITVYWGPQREFDLADEDELVKAYRNIVREGTSTVQEETLNAEALRRVWKALTLPARCERLWTSAFPELAA